MHKFEAKSNDTENGGRKGDVYVLLYVEYTRVRGTPRVYRENERERGSIRIAYYNTIATDRRMCSILFHLICIRFYFGEWKIVRGRLNWAKIDLR